ncbi:MAG: DUF58 domain-containing protein [Actinomycetota bacterium]
MTRRSTERFVLAVLASTGGLVAAVLAGRPDAALLSAPWAVLLVLGIVGGRRPRIEATAIVGAERAMVGDPIPVEAAVRVTGAAAATVRLDPARGYELDDEGPSPAVHDVADERASGGRLRTTWTVVGTQWGTHPLGGLTITAHGPYGLMDWTRSFPAARSVRLHPDRRRLQELLTPHLVRRLAGAHPATTRDRGIEYADVRPFASGDSVRDINWRASARAGDLWVSQRHPDRATDVVLLVDSFIESGHDVRTVFGLAIEAAVALADGHLSATDRVGLVQLGGVVRWVAPGTGRLALQRLTDALLSTRLYASAAERDLAVVPPRALPPRSFVVAISPLLDERFVSALMEARGAGHDVVCVECVATPEHPGDGEVARLARRLWEGERALARDRLADAGVAVGRWHRGEALDPVLRTLRNRRARTPRTGR